VWIGRNNYVPDKPTTFLFRIPTRFIIDALKFTGKTQKKKKKSFEHTPNGYRVKVAQEHAMMAQKGRRSITLLFL